jgi:hypothetical protein
MTRGSAQPSVVVRANKLLIIDLRRWRAPVHLVVLAVALPFTGLIPLLHDGVIGSLRA